VNKPYCSHAAFLPGKQESTSVWWGRNSCLTPGIRAALALGSVNPGWSASTCSTSCPSLWPACCVLEGNKVMHHGEKF